MYTINVHPLEKSEEFFDFLKFQLCQQKQKKYCCGLSVNYFFFLSVSSSSSSSFAFFSSASHLLIVSLPFPPSSLCPSQSTTMLRQQKETRYIRIHSAYDFRCDVFTGTIDLPVSRGSLSAIGTATTALSSTGKEARKQ